MRRTAASREFRFIIILTFIGLVAILALRWFGPASRQRENMDAAARHIKSLQPILQRDPRFGKIRLAPYTADDGSLLVRGELSLDHDLEDLKQIVATSKPPVNVVYMVTTDEPAASEPAR